MMMILWNSLILYSLQSWSLFPFVYWSDYRSWVLVGAKVPLTEEELCIEELCFLDMMIISLTVYKALCLSLYNFIFIYMFVYSAS